MSKIFIQIASYRDPELKKTIKDCIDNSKFPENLVFGICRQYHPEDGFDDLSEYENDDRFRILNILYNESLGACWARHSLQQLYSGETYTLQIDSHMRFIKNWDDEVITMLESLKTNGIEKPLLTGYVSSYNPETDPEGRVMEPWEMVFDRFIPEGTVFTLPQVIPNWVNTNEPIPTRFYSAHFAFTDGVFVKEVPHDPFLYFHSEEMSIAVRSWTNGYDLFHPHKIICWHEYTRNNRVKVWDDDKVWYKKNDNSHLRNRKLFSMDGETYNPEEFGVYGFGTKRSLREYEKYSGIHFQNRSVQQYTLDKKYPPNPYNYETEEEWLGSFTQVFKHCIDLSFDSVPENDYEYWVVAFHNEKDETIFRKDADKNEILRMKQDPDRYCKLWREFNVLDKPKYWVVWPFSTSKGWCDRIVGNL
jgi:hypothetical protein